LTIPIDSKGVLASDQIQYKGHLLSFPYINRTSKVEPG
jgi:hypothetical protein